MMAVQAQITCSLQFLANGLPGARHTYACVTGQVVSDAVAADIESTPQRARDVMATIDQWHRGLDVMCDLDLVLEQGTVEKSEVVKDGDNLALEVVVDGATYSYEYIGATGVLVVKARAEVSVSYAAFRFLRDQLVAFLALLPTEP